MAPIEMVGYNWPNHLVFIQIVENAIRAEREGYDAVAISCFLDPALEAARSMVDIPVVSSCETTLLVSSAISRAFGFLTLDEIIAGELRELISRYGYQDRVKVVAAMDPPINEHQLDQAFAGSSEFAKEFSLQAERLTTAGADLIIPAEGVLNTALVRNKVREVDGTPILDSYGSLLAFAEMLVKLRHRSGLSVARGGAYARAPQKFVEHLRKITANFLTSSEDC
jgi:Asp/Glu/hydantoin racemase